MSDRKARHARQDYCARMAPSSQRDAIVEKQYRKSYTVVELDQNKHTYERSSRFESVVPPGPCTLRVSASPAMHWFTS
jgi:hypothetical protein